MVSKAERDNELLQNLNEYVQSVNSKYGSELALVMQNFIDSNFSELSKFSDGEIITLLNNRLSTESTKIDAKKVKATTQKVKGAFNGLKEGILQTVDEMHKSAKLLMVDQREKANLDDLQNDFNVRLIVLREKTLRTLNYKQISQLGRKFYVPDMKTISYFNGRYTKEKKVRQEYDDYVSELIQRNDASIEDFLDFTSNCGVREVYKFRQELDEIKKDYSESYTSIKLSAENERRSIRGEAPLVVAKPKQFPESEQRVFLEKIAEKIRTYVPKKSSQVEVSYQLMLCGYLQNDYPDIELEIQKGSSRPDLVIHNVGIEVKGPTYNGDLQTIADKLLRYPQHFGGGVIIVLFDVQVYDRFYHEWLEGVKRIHPEAIVIRR